MAQQTFDRSIVEGTIWKQLIRYALPILLGSLFQQLYTTTDAMIVGQFIGKEALAAIDSTASLARLFTNLFVGLASGATILISQQYGAGDEEGIPKTLHTALAFALAGGLLLAAVGNMLIGPGMNWMSIPEDIRPQASVYLRIYFIGMLPSMAYNMAAGILRAIGDTKRPLYFLIVSTVCNIVLDLLFVVGFGWGVAGAAWATILSQGVSLVLALRVLTREKGPLKLRLRGIRIHREVLRRVLRLGLPIGLQSAMYPISNMVVQSTVNRLGTDTIAAWAVCGKIDLPIWLVMDALAISVSTFVAQNFGAARCDRVRQSTRVSIGLGHAVILPMSLLLYLFCGAFARLFVNDGSVIALTEQVMRSYAPFFFVFIWGEVMSGAIRGTGETFRPMLLTLLGTCVLRIAWIWIAVPIRPGIFTIVAAYPVTWIATSAAYIIYYRRYMRRKLPAAYAVRPGGV